MAFCFPLAFLLASSRSLSASQATPRRCSIFPDASLPRHPRYFRPGQSPVFIPTLKPLSPWTATASRTQAWGSRTSSGFGRMSILLPDGSGSSCLLSGKGEGVIVIGETIGERLESGGQTWDLNDWKECPWRRTQLTWLANKFSCSDRDTNTVIFCFRPGLLPPCLPSLWVTASAALEWEIAQ